MSQPANTARKKSDFSELTPKTPKTVCFKTVYSGTVCCLAEQGSLETETLPGSWPETKFKVLVDPQRFSFLPCSAEPAQPLGPPGGQMLN